MKFTIVLKLFSLLILFIGLGQECAAQPGKLKKEKYPTYFGFQIRPIFPSSFIGQNSEEYKFEEKFINSLSLQNGVSYGANVRFGFTKLLAFETGINYTKRNFLVEFEYKDSNVVSSSEFSFVNFDVPLNLLTYIQLSEKYFMNASLGVQLRFNPSNAGVFNEPYGNLRFSHTAFAQYVNFDFNANIGFELRTEENGFFYIGGSGCVPMSKVFEFYASYTPKSSTILQRASGSYRGAYLALDLKYFFPYRKRASTPQPRGPIE